MCSLMKPSAGPDLSDLSLTSYSYAGEPGQVDHQGIAFNPDGDKMVVTRDTDQDVISYDLSTPWDVSTRVKDEGGTWDVTGLVQPQDCVWNADGTRLILIATGGTDKYYWADCSTPYDLGTVGATSSEDVGESSSIVTCLWFSADGLTMQTGVYIASDNHDIFQYTLSTPWDPSTKGSGVVVLDSEIEQATPGYGIEYAPDGLKVYIGDTINNELHQYNLTVAFDLTTATWNQKKDLSEAPATLIAGMHMKPDGTAIFSCHSATGRVYIKWE